MANTDFSILLKTLIDKSGINSELAQVQKIVNKHSVDIIPELKTASLRNQIKSVSEEIAKDFNKTFGTNLTGKDVFKDYENQAKQAEKAISDAQKSRLAEQEKYYGRIINNNKEIYALKEKKLIADKEESKELQRQINNLTKKNKRAYDSISQKGLGDKDWGLKVSASERELKNSLALKEARLQDKAVAQEQINIEKELAEQTERRKKIMNDLNKIQLLSNGGIKNDYATQIAQLEGNFRRLGLSQDEVNQKTTRVSAAYNELKNRMSQPFTDSNYQEIIALNNTLQRELIESSNEYSRLQASFKGFATEQQRLSLANTIESWNQKNTAATKKTIEENQRYIASLRDLGTEMRKVNFDKINTGFKQNENAMRNMGKLGKSVKDQFTQAYQSFTMWLSASTAVMKVISETREALTELKNINTLLTEISKANEKLTKEQLSDIGDNSFDIASKYGKKASDFLKGVQEASRAGYDNAEAMAELSTAAQSAGDMTSDIANQFIIATDKAYKLNGSVSELTKVLDGVNYITNHNAVNMTELSEAMTIVGSTAASFGVGSNELTAALGTMAATTQQSGSEVARAFRAILLNIRQISDEEENIDAEGLTKYEKACNALGVSLKETKNGVLQTRDAMEVLKDLSVEYNKLEENDVKKVNLLNSVGGKVYHVV